MNSKLKTIREFKGKSLLEFPSTYCLIDIETTGLDPKYDEIIEIAAIKVVDGTIVDKKSSLIKPNYPVDEFIAKLTGITNELLTSAPLLEDILSEFSSFWKNDILIGHNVNFDINFLYDNSIAFYSIPIRNNYVDVLRLARKLLPELKNHKLATLKNHFGIVQNNQHRALIDVEDTLNILNELQKIYQLNFNQKFPINNRVNRSKISLKASDITTANFTFNTEHPFYNKIFVFTGTLEKLLRKEAMQLVVDLGGECTDGVNKKTNYLVLGNQDYSKIKEGKSSKHKKAEQLKLMGQDIDIISEDFFYEMLQDN
jgi:DNA polymerase III subunit epsilon